MLKIYSEATNKNLYGDYSFLVNRVLLVLSIIGSFISAYTEWYGFKSWNTTELGQTAFPVAMILLVESSRFVIPLLVLTIFRLWYEKEYALRLPALFVLLGLSAFLTFLSLEGSKDGISAKVVNSNILTDSVKVDKTKYQILMAQCESQFKSENDRIESDVKKEFNKDLKAEQKKARKAKQRISEIKHVSDNWATATVAKKSNVLRVAMGTVSEINKEVKEEVANRSNLANANHEACKASANDTLLYYINKAEIENNKLIAANDKKIKRTINVSNLAMYAGILLIWIYSIAKGWLYYVSGRRIIYKFGEEDKQLNFAQKFASILVQYLNLFGNWLLDIFGSKLEEVKRDEQLRQEQRLQQEKAKQQALQQALQQEQQAAQQLLLLQQHKQQQAALQRKQQIQQQQQQMAAENAKIAAQIAKDEAEAIKAKTAAKNALIIAEAKAAEAKAKAEAERINAETTSTLSANKIRLENERLERQAAQQIKDENRRARLKHEEEQRAANLAAKKVRLEDERIEREATNKRLQQERLLIQQEKEEQEQREQQLQQVKEVSEQLQHVSDNKQQASQQLTTALKTITTPSTTRNDSDYQAVMKVLNRVLLNGVVTRDNKFDTTIKQWHSRNIQAMIKLQTATTRIQQIKNGIESRQNKINLMTIELAKYNVKCFVDSDNKINFEG